MNKKAQEPTNHANNASPGANLGDSEWHFVNITRNVSQSIVQLDTQSAVLLHPTGYLALDTTNQSFFGGLHLFTLVRQRKRNSTVVAGVPNFAFTNATHIFTNSYFVGCLQNVLLNTFNPAQALSLATATVASGVTEGPCDNTDSCSVSPCQNGAACVDTFASHTCSCTGFYTGASCNQSLSHLDNCDRILIFCVFSKRDCQFQRKCVTIVFAALSRAFLVVDYVFLLPLFL